jgi:hypothetical protein
MGDLSHPPAPAPDRIIENLLEQPRTYPEAILHSALAPWPGRRLLDGRTTRAFTGGAA